MFAVLKDLMKVESVDSDDLTPLKALTSGVRVETQNLEIHGSNLSENRSIILKFTQKLSLFFLVRCNSVG